MTKLKTCPFCGKTPTLFRYPFNDIISCQNQRCYVQPSIGICHEYGRCDDEIIDKWNTRDGEHE